MKEGCLEKPAKHPATTENMWESYCLTNSLFRASHAVGMTRDKLRKVLIDAGYKLNNQKWDNNDDLLLIELFNDTENNWTPGYLSDKLKRTPYSIFARAEKLGITEPPTHRSKTNQLKAAQHTASVLQQAGVESLAAGLPVPVTPPQPKKSIPRKAGVQYYQKYKGGWETVGGKKIFFRSKWEINYAYYLEWLKDRGEIISWEFEPETFFFEGIRQGHTSYLPDFKVHYPDGTHQWHEVKGFLDAGSKTKLSRFAKFFPDEKLVLVDSEAYTQLKNKLSSIIPGWKYD